MPATRRIVGQVLRNMTVQIREPAYLSVRGTGVLVSPSGLVATCAHVVRDCEVDPRVAQGDLVSVRLPATPEHEAEDRSARVAWFPADSEDDLVLLELLGGPIPPERVGICSAAADRSDEHIFRSFGFRQREEYLGLLAKGYIEGHVPSPRQFLVEPVQLESRDLDSGMSGAAVFDLERNLVVGFVFQVWESAGSQKDRDLAFAVDAAVLSGSPVGELLVHSALEYQPMPEPEVDPSILAPADPPAPAARWAIETAPDILGVFVGREQDLDAIDEAWDQGKVRILGLSGLNGQGKTSLIRRWLDRRRNSAQCPPSVLWWTFDPSTNEVDDFLAAVIRHVSAGAVDPARLPLSTAKANLAASLLLSDQRHILVLDGLDGLMADAGELTGSFTSEALKDFLGYVAAGEHQSMCILTAPRAFSDLEFMATFAAVSVTRLTGDEGRLLLRSNGVIGDDQVLDAIVDDWDGHSLALTAVASYLRDAAFGLARRVTELPGTSTDLPLTARLQAIGDAVEQRRSALQRSAIAFLALARLPLPLPALSELISGLPPADSSGPGPDAMIASLTELAGSDVVRRTADGDLLLHPVLRNLYRARLRRHDPGSLRDRHRALAEFYYNRALGRGAGQKGGA